MEFKIYRKKLRYDGILYNDPTFMKPIESILIGTTGIKLEGEINDLFRKYMVGAKEDDIKYYKNDKVQKLFELFPSDHFGVITKFELK